MLVENLAVDDARKAAAVRPKLNEKMENAGVTDPQGLDNASSSDRAALSVPDTVALRKSACGGRFVDKTLGALS